MKGKDKQVRMNENELHEVSGGIPGIGYATVSRCYFSVKPGAEAKVYKNVFSLECGSNCWGCKCHERDWCVDRMHQVTPVNKELLPYSHANHKQKTPENNYNTCVCL